jgi:hypothetical protein
VVFPEGQARVFLYGQPVNMCLSFDGLYVFAKHVMHQDPLSGHLFAFINRRATEIRVLYFDRSGLCMLGYRSTRMTRRYRSTQTTLSVRRRIPMGKKNWLFSWTELGPKHVGIVQSLLATFRLHDINRYDYFVDVLQRVGQHPASLVEQLTPRIWKEMFANNPLRSDLHELRGRSAYTAACRLHYLSRAAQHVETALGLQRRNGVVLQSDGYGDYEHNAKKTAIMHAQCWAHARRKIFDARDIEPAQADHALHMIAGFYKFQQVTRHVG